MKVLILGGTSFFGKEIARFFHEAGYEITIFSRGNRKPEDLPPHRHFRGDRGKLDDLRGVAGRDPWDVIVDNIAYTGRDMELANEAFSGRGRYILCSTVSVYRYAPNPFPQPLKENSVDFSYQPKLEDPSDVHWKYARGKLEAEKALIQRSDKQWTILRPPLVYGPFDPTNRGFWYLGRILKGGPILLANSGANSFRLGYSTDVAKCFLDVSQRENTLGETYNMAQEEVMTLRDFVEESARVLGKDCSLLSVPLEYLGEMAGPFASMINFIPDISKAQRDFGFRATPWPEWARSTAQWFVDSWHGDEAKLFETRASELDFAKRWVSATSTSAST